MPDRFCPECDTELTRSELASGYCPVCAAPLGGSSSGYRERRSSAADYPDEREYSRGRGDRGDYRRDEDRDRYSRDRYDDYDDRYDDRYDDYDDYDRYDRRRDSSAAWSKTSKGLSNMLIGIAMVLIAAAVMFVVVLLGVAIAGPGGGGRNMQAYGVFALLAVGTSAIVIFVGALLGFIGYCMCCHVPKESGARNFIVWSLICFLLSVMGGFMQGCMGASAGPGGPPPADLAPVMMMMTLVQNGLNLASWILFLLFLRGVALYFDNQGLATSCMVYLCTAVGVGVLFVILLLTTSMFAFANPAMFRGNPQAFFGAMMGVVGVVAIAAIGLYIWYIILLVQTRNTIREGRGSDRRRRRDW